MTAKGYLTSDLLKNLKDITLANIVFIEILGVFKKFWPM